MDIKSLNRLSGSIWAGKGELWLDPEGNNAVKYDCQLHIDGDAINYTWSYENESQKGQFKFNEAGAVWFDSWHHADSVQCNNVADVWGIFTLFYAYEVPDNPNWGWRSTLSQRPDGALVLQMTNIAPWGEEGRAVRMVFLRK